MVLLLAGFSPYPSAMAVIAFIWSLWSSIWHIQRSWIWWIYHNKGKSQIPYEWVDLMFLPGLSEAELPPHPDVYFWLFKVIILLKVTHACRFVSQRLCIKENACHKYYMGKHSQSINGSCLPWLLSYLWKHQGRKNRIAWRKNREKVI